MEDIYIKSSKLSDEDFKMLIGVTKTTFNEMLELLNVAYALQHVKGGRPRKLSIENQLLLTLRYLRHYPTQRLLAFDFEVGLATVNETILWVENTLIEDGRFNLDTVKLDTEHSLAIDVTESPIRRPKKTKVQTTQEKRRDTH